ncbi:hypothetical protein N7449_005435 [Penicillium cf. viridicatum]|uniref:Uncharacterized protein n=1 Tax=Penicillium cf. viridicatum TaxID=2972119 RepID=A0A9W9ML38_9EURO|nr:hypothetical protein N7449_005435 [Penicillium cf. viridicatum]
MYYTPIGLQARGLGDTKRPSPASRVAGASLSVTELVQLLAVCERCQKTKGPREECKYVTPSSRSCVQPPLIPNLPTPSASTFSLPEPSDVHEDAIDENFNEIVGDDVN